MTVESILIQAAAHSEDPGTKVLLVSWTYQVGGRSQGSCAWQKARTGGVGQGGGLTVPPTPTPGHRMKS